MRNNYLKRFVLIELKGLSNNKHKIIAQTKAVNELLLL